MKTNLAKHRLVFLMVIFVAAAAVIATDDNQADIAVKTRPLPPVMLKGKPFFPIGSFDARPFNRLQPMIYDEWLQAGGNIVIIGYANVENSKISPHATHATNTLFKTLDAIKDDKRFEDVALVVHLLGELIYEIDEEASSKHASYRMKVIGEENMAVYTERLKSIVAQVAKYPNVVGYTIDEPENQVWPSFSRERLKVQERSEVVKSVGTYLAEGLAWVYDTIKKEHPDSYSMPIIAWWDQYKTTAPIYDINIPNNYPDHDVLYNVVYDAALAVDAVREGNRYSVIYMPPMYNTYPGAPIRSLREVRYLCFAPVTQGAMGVFGWRLQYCSNDYRQAVIYPVMRELRRCVPWFLGEWHDEKVSSDHDTPTADYLTKFPERIRLVEGMEDARMEKVPGVPDCSHMLRRRTDDGSYLLLAVNNRREPQEIKFKIRDIPHLPAEMLEILEYRPVKLNEDGSFIACFEPFGVQVYTFKPTASDDAKKEASEKDDE